MTTNPSIADQLLDAQVAWVLGEVTGDRLQDVIERDVDDVLAIAATVRLDAVIDPDDVTRVIRRLLATVPASTAGSTLLEAGTDVVYDGPAGAVAPSQLMSREHADALVGELLGLYPVAERALDRLTDSPMVGTIASRFITRIVTDVLQANRSVAEKIPGVGSLMSIGTNAASKVVGAADKQIQALVGDTAGKGAAFAIRRLNKVVIDTLQDPMLRDALMEVWDQHADDPIESIQEVVPREDIHRIAGVLQDIVIAAASTAPVDAYVDAFVTAFFGIYGEYPVPTLLEELEISRDDIVAELQIVLPRLVDAAREDGRLEAAIRTRLGPFFTSPAVTTLLAG